MSVSQVSICNAALVKIGADRISSITQDTKSARLLNAIWDQTRDSVMRAHPWNFAIKRATFTPDGTEPDYEYDYQYTIPSDCLRVLDEEDEDTDWVVENGLILSNESEISVRYIYRNTDESSWDACFAEALSWRLAHDVSYNLTQSSTLMDMCDKKYRAVLAEARSMDGAEGITRNIVVDTWTRARR